MLHAVFGMGLRGAKLRRVTKAMWDNREMKIMKWTRRSTLAAVAAVLLATSAPAMAELKFGVAAEPYPPFTSKDASGKWVGWEIDAMDAVCAEMKETCTVVEVAWDGIIPALTSKQIDVIWSSMLITDKRKETIDFTQTGSIVNSLNERPGLFR